MAVRAVFTCTLKPVTSTYISLGPKKQQCYVYLDRRVIRTRNNDLFPNDMLLFTGLVLLTGLQFPGFTALDNLMNAI